MVEGGTSPGPRVLVFLTLLAGCNDPGFALVSITPIYGWTDGCNAVTLSGHGFGKNATAKIGGGAVAGITYPESPKNPLTPTNVGYIAYGVAPAGTHGYADVSLTSDGQTSTIGGTGGYYYVSCPGPGWVDTVTPDAAAEETIAAGATITINGCGLDPATQVARIRGEKILAAREVPLTTACERGVVTFTAPDLPPGLYDVEIADATTGELLSGTACSDRPGLEPADSADTAASACVRHNVRYGAAL